MIKFKEIKLVPTTYYLDVIIGNRNKEIDLFLKNRYGFCRHEVDETTNNEVFTAYTTKESELKGEIRIILRLKSLNTQTLIHELNHVLWHLSKSVGLEMNFDSQEWQSYFLDYLYEQIKEKDYKKL